jgi:tetratricopeptide (TPR) repeat protein
MATNRLELLQQMLQQDPANTFARYGLAMEYANTGDLEKAMEEFRQLIGQDETYCAAYFHGGQCLEKSGKVAEARDLYEKGIAACTRKGDLHTRAEIEAALNLLPV